jgi:hypothetical protein
MLFLVGCVLFLLQAIRTGDVVNALGSACFVIGCVAFLAARPGSPASLGDRSESGANPGTGGDERYPPITLQQHVGARAEVDQPDALAGNEHVADTHPA